MYKPSYLSGVDYDELDYLGEPESEVDDDVDNDDDDDSATPSDEDVSFLMSALQDKEVQKMAKDGGKLLINEAIKGRGRKAALVQYAQKLGYPDAAEVPGFVLRAVKRSANWRARKAGKYTRISQRLQRRGKYNNRYRKAKIKLGILAIADQLIAAEQQAQTQTTPTTVTPVSNVQVPVLNQTTELTDQNDQGGLTPEEKNYTWYYVGGAVGVLALGAAAWYFGIYRPKHK